MPKYRFTMCAKLGHRENSIARVNEALPTFISHPGNTIAGKLHTIKLDTIESGNELILNRCHEMIAGDLILSADEKLRCTSNPAL